MSSQPSELITVFAAVVQRDGKYLVCQRPPEKRHGGLWEFPGGKLEPGETLEQAAHRELIEELGVTVTAVGETLFSVQDPGSVFLIKFVQTEFAGSPTCIEHTAHSWSEVSALQQMALAPSDLKFVKHLAAAET
jgi:mutator protein MutT